MRWYVVQCEPRHERLVGANILGLGIEVYSPAFMVDGRSRAMFPGYLFARFDVTDIFWPPILRQPGVISVLGSPTPIPEWFVPGLMDQISQARAAADAPKPTPQEGDHVTVTAGPFAGLHAIVQASKGERVRILLDILGGNIPTIVSRDNIVAAHSTKCWDR